jgi:acyl carrier protein
MNKHLETITLDTVWESASLKPANRESITASTKFHELGIDSITMLSILLKLENKMSSSLDLLGDQLEAPGNMGELLTIVELLAQVNEQLKTNSDE